MQRIDQTDNLCSHMLAMMSQQEKWTNYILLSQQDDNEDVDGIDIEDGTMTASGKMDEIVLVEDSKNYFDTTTGLWDFGGLSTHKPTAADDRKLSINIQKRMEIHDGSTSRDEDGYFIDGAKIPQFTANCHCGIGYENVLIPDNRNVVLQYSKQTRLYTRQGPVKFKVYCRKCRSGQCVTKYTGEQDGIHFWKEETAMADELGHDFLRRMFSSKLSFSAFCAEMTATYKSISPSSASFMSKSTFVDCFFSWAGRMSIDFRKSIDPWCSPNPKMLACDGTHVGVTFRQLNAIPIENSETENVVKTVHKRYDRVFICNDGNTATDRMKAARTYLKYICKTKECVKSLPLPEITIKENEIERKLTKNELHDCLLQCTPSECRMVISLYISGKFQPPLSDAVGKLLKLLSSDAPVSAVIPPSACNDIAKCLEHIRQGINFQQKLNVLANSCPEVKNVIDFVLNTGHENVIFNFVKYMSNFVSTIHENDEVSQADMVENSYNPEKGVAYYFTNTGDQVRKLPKYDMDKVRKNNNFDDMPCTQERCSKKYPLVSKRGYCHVFIWFCPVHGHSYGFHLIPGAEGRKDPFASLFKYLPEPPSDVFYDFACSLCEYCLNREPGYFKNVRFWHDLFHGCTHVCGEAHHSSRFHNLTVNSEICEQFNSFLQCIKYTGTHLSQSRFMFFMQYALHHWNERKTKAFQERLKIALNGLQ